MTSPQADPLRVLVVDDDAHLLKTLRDILALHGHPVTLALTGQEAVVHAARELPQVALVDLRLPDASGMELIRRMHELSPLTQAIVLTGNASVDSAVGALRHQVYDYLVKPVSPPMLLATVARAGERWRTHKAEEALRRSESRAQLLLETISDLVIALDDAGVVRHVSPSVERMLGIAPERVLGGRWDALVHPDDATLAREHVQAASPTSTALSIGAIRAKHRDGSSRLLELTVKGFTDVSGAMAVLITGRDVTEREQLAAERQRAQRLESIGTMAGGVAHDFNNILTAILGFTELLLDATPTGTPAHQDIQTIQRAAEHGTSLSRQLLAFSRRQLLDPKLIDVRALLRNMAVGLEDVLGKRSTLIVEPELDPLYVRVDPSQLEQVIMNLVRNARDAMPGGGTLSLRVARVGLSDDDVYKRGKRLSAGSYVALSASDTGCGMSPEAQARMFEPFFTTKGLGKGTGLGLPSMYGIVQQSGGHIDVASEVGAGTTFTILLPEVDAPLPESATPSRLAHDACARVLVVEDQAAVRQLMTRTLRRAGHEVLEAASAEEGLEIVNRLGDSIELLVTDAVLPGRSGPTLASQALLRVPGMRVLFVSGYSDDAALRLGIVSARDAFLQKPFGPNVFARKVQEVLGATH